MKKIISLILIMLFLLSVSLALASCGKEEPLDIEIPKKEDEKDNSMIEGDIDIDDIIDELSKNPSYGNDEDNTWNKDGNAIGSPVVIPQS